MKKTIEVKNLSKSYQGVSVVKNLSFDVKRGEVFGLLGANGAGKSTTIECILGTRSMDSGSAFILGMSPKTERKKIFEQVGVQFQETNYPDKIKIWELCEETENLYNDTKDYNSLLKEFGLYEKRKNYITELSGGQKQRLFIVLALIPNPKVVFLDELTTGLDTKARRDVWKCLLNLKKSGLTIFLTSHFMDEVEELCDNILILKKGNEVYRGSVDKAIKNSPYENFEDAYLWYSGEEN
ncbi:ABC transporter ATP-binding protein [Anaerofustis stercorihominis]|uniref:ABC transporter ATP-binding protein n=1 Tax=Anaerofustis stercorihominis TaxID=214853 RepID=A0A3E3DZB0_9FIRM|nr:ABC transporter ATP-binding protein [Anaerofustis stercorihominis]RGD74573.1 ABC transporter ATP-binding protein [Anaerofustis stercorihominis]